MGESIKLSVLTPVYNVEKYLPRAIESLVNQTYKNIEIILVDDGATDRSGEICDEYAQKDDRIIVIHKANGGILSALLAGMEAATGEYIIAFGSDDWIEENAYEMVMERIEEYHPDVVSFGMIKDYEDFTDVYPNLIKEGFYTREEYWKLFNEFVDENPFFSQAMDMSQATKAVRADLFKKHELNCDKRLKRNVDEATVFPTLLDMESIYVDSRCWYHYCVRKTSVTWENEKEDYNKIIYLSHQLVDAYKMFNGHLLGTGKFLLYKTVHHMMLEVPEFFCTKEGCSIYPQLRKDSKIVVYGKGEFAMRLIARFKELEFTDIVANIDSHDANRLEELEDYDYIIVAVFNSRIVKAILKTLGDYHIAKDKILIIEKEKIHSRMLPEDVRKKYEEATEIE